MDSNLNSVKGRVRSGNSESDDGMSTTATTFLPSEAETFLPNSSASVYPEATDTSFPQVPTVLIDAGHPTPVNPNPKPASPKKYQYLQGIVQNQKAYVVTNLLEGKSQALVQPQMVWTIGRNRQAALPLEDRAMSRHHAVILYVKDQGFYLIDLNSMNGSYVNDIRVQQRQFLQDGDHVRLGNTDFIFFISHGARTLETVHPEVFARFNTMESRSKQFIDYSALDEPDIFFNGNRL